MSRTREFAELATAYDSGGGFGFRNKIINGDCRIDQRNAGASVTNTTGAVWPVDRFRIAGSSASKMTGQRSSVAPSGFANSLLVTSSSAYSVPAAEAYEVAYQIEGNDLASFGWGGSSAQSAVLSFWVRSSLTGTFAIALQNNGNSRTLISTYTVSAANTWEQKTIVIPGDTTGTWLTDNNRGLIIRWDMGCGSNWQTSSLNSWSGTERYSATGAVSVVGTNGATFYITGVQLEAGSVATPFERRPYGTELALCQRYFWTLGGRLIYLTAYGLANLYMANLFFPVAMRAAPTITNNLGGAGVTVPAQAISTLGFGIYNATAGSSFDAATASAEL